MDHDPDPGIINGILPLQDMGNCQNFVGSAALGEVCDLLMLLLFIYFKAYQHKAAGEKTKQSVKQRLQYGFTLGVPCVEERDRLLLYFYYHYIIIYLLYIFHIYYLLLFFYYCCYRYCNFIIL